MVTRLICKDHSGPELLNAIKTFLQLTSRCVCQTQNSLPRSMNRRLFLVENQVVTYFDILWTCFENMEINLWNQTFLESIKHSAKEKKKKGWKPTLLSKRSLDEKSLLSRVCAVSVLTVWMKSQKAAEFVERHEYLASLSIHHHQEI